MSYHVTMRGNGLGTTIRNSHNEHEAIANVASERGRRDERAPQRRLRVLLIYKLDMQ